MTSVLVALLAGLAWVSDVNASSDCVDMSGTYQVEEGSCGVLESFPEGSDVTYLGSFPINGGVTSMSKDTVFRLEQEGCENLKIFRQVEPDSKDFFEFALSLVPLQERMEVTWGPQGFLHSDRWIRYTSCAANWWDYWFASSCAEFDRLIDWEMTRVGNELVLVHSESVYRYRLLRSQKLLTQIKTQCRFKKLQ